MPNGGDLLEIKYSNDDVGEGSWFPKSNEDSTFDLGGDRFQDDANMVDGGGRPIRIKNRVRWSLEATVSWDANVTDELTQARLLCSSNAPTVWTISHINGTVWKGTGDFVGDIQGNGNAATMSIKLAGGSVMEKIVG